MHWARMQRLSTTGLLPSASPPQKEGSRVAPVIRCPPLHLFAMWPLRPHLRQTTSLGSLQSESQCCPPQCGHGEGGGFFLSGSGNSLPFRVSLPFLLLTSLESCLMAARISPSEEEEAEEEEKAQEEEEKQAEELLCG